MIDLTIISTHHDDIQINSDLALGRNREFARITDLHPAYPTHLKVRDSGTSSESSRRFAIIQLHPGLVLHASRDGAGYKLQKVELNHGKLLHGHNGIPVTSDDLMSLAFQRALALVRPVLCDQSQAERIIPGSEGSLSYYRSVELPFQIHDPHRTLHAGFRHMRHPMFRGKPMWVRNETYTLKGSGGRKLIAYQKDKEMVRLASENSSIWRPVNHPETLRIEATLVESIFEDYFPGHCFDEIQNCRRLVGFSIQEALNAFRGFLSRAEGVFFTPTQGTSSKVPAFIASLGSSTDLSIVELTDLYQAACNVSDDCRARILREARRVHSQHCSLDVDTLFSDEAFTNQPALRIPNLEHAINELWQPSAA